MARGPEITNEVRMLIAKLHKQHLKWTNKKIRNEVSKALRDENPSLPKSWPSKYSIDRIMPGIRERVRKGKLEPNPLDKPWTIHSMANYPIPPEALPSVLRVWYMAKDWAYSLTIREALWAARLYATLKDTELLMRQSNEFASFEKGCAEAGVEYSVPRDTLPWVNLHMFDWMTGHKRTRAEFVKDIRWRAEYSGLADWFWLNPKPDERDALGSGSDETKRKIKRELARRWGEGEADEETEQLLKRIRQEYGAKEAESERKQERSKNERRHKKAR